MGSSRTPSSGRPQRGAQPGCHLGQRQTLAKPLATGDVGPEVEVAEAEPLRLRSVGRKLTLDGVGLVRAAPTLFLVDGATEGVHEGVEVGADSQSEEVDVVTGVTDHGDAGVGQVGGAVSYTHLRAHETVLD